MSHLDWYPTRFPRGMDADAIVASLRPLGTRHRHGWLHQAHPVVFEVESTGGRLSWWLGCTRSESVLLIGALQAHLPGIRLDRATGRTRAPMRSGIELRTDTGLRPLRTDVAGESSLGILHALQSTSRSETLAVQWIVGPWLPRAAVKPVSGQSPPRTIWNLPDWGTPSLDSEQISQLRKKQSEALVGATGRIAVNAASTGREQELLRRIVGAMQVIRAPGVGLSTRHLIPSSWVPSRLERLARPTISWPCVLSVDELASVLGWPIGNPRLHGVSYQSARALPATDGSRLSETVATAGTTRVTGKVSYPGQNGLLHLPAEGGLRHLHVLGPTGVGKSTLLANMVLADITAGRGVVLFDAKADLVADVLNRVPEVHRARVVVLDPADLELPVGLNVLAGGDPEVLVDGVVHLFRSLYFNTPGSAPRTQDVLHAGLLTLATTRPEFGGRWTMAELPVLLTDAGFRRTAIKRLPPDDLSGLRSFWSWFENMSEPERANVIAPLMSRLRAFTLRPALRLMLGQSDGFTFRKVFTERQVVLVSLAKARLGPETANLVGGLLLSALWAEIQRRTEISQDRRHPVFVYLDEFQDYLGLPLDLSDALAQARGLGVGFVLAHQFLGQLSPAVKPAVLGTVRSRIAFQLGQDDARTIAGIMGGGLTPDDLSGLSAFETYQQLFLGNATAPPASATTLPLAPSLRSEAQIRAASSERWGRPRAEVEAELRSRRQVTPPSDGSVGTTPRRPQRGQS